ncbi:hypothetical protein FOVSG1_013396 [Fusarium oxysporum f. sp. vasinfectum]
MWSPFGLIAAWTVLQTYLAVSASPVSRAGPLVKLQNGTLEGLYNPTYHQDIFLGIPYASPPVGSLRLQKPTPPKAWNGTKMADSHGPWCMGNSMHLAGFSQTMPEDMSEDCLHLNIVRPSGTHANAKLPVLAWIHGGGLIEGSANDLRNNGSFLVRNSVQMNLPILFISFNYRLGVFGILAGSALENAGLTNLALRDQRQALIWIQENIARFGGDPSRVTIMGESAGAFSVGSHLLAYGGRDDGLFGAAIAESGGPFPFGLAASNETQNEAVFNGVLSTVGCTDAADPLECIRNAPANLLNSVNQPATTFTVDGDILPDTNMRLLDDGRFVRVPILTGSNRNEGTAFEALFMPNPINTYEDFSANIKAYLERVTIDEQMIQAWSKLYQEEIDDPSAAGLGMVLSNPGFESGSEYGKMSLLLGDLLFAAGRRLTNQLWYDNGVPSYSYFFDTVTANVDAKTLGVSHYQEIPYVFGNMDGVGWEVNPFPTEPSLRRKHEKVAEIMSHMWISFATTGSPNNHQGLNLPFGCLICVELH